MVFHLAAFSESVDQSLGNITPITDPQLTVSGDDLTVGRDLRFIAGLLVGAPTIDSARIVAPSLYTQFTGGGPDISPVNVAAEPSSPLPYHDWRATPLELMPSEKLNVQIANSGAGSAEDAWALLLLASGAIQPQPGAWRPFKFTTSAAAVTAEAWSNRSLTPAQALVPGTYAVGGGYAVSTSGRAFRLVFQGQAARPGGVMGDAESDVLAMSVFRNGGLGVWGTFTHDQLPTIDFFCDAADNEAQEVYLDLIRVA